MSRRSTGLKLSSEAIPSGAFVDYGSQPLGETQVRLRLFGRDAKVSVEGRRAVPACQKPPGFSSLGGFTDHIKKAITWAGNNSAVVWRSLLTVTYPERWPSCGRCCRHHLRMLLQAIQRKYPGSTYIWVREFQKRGAPHWHILLDIVISGRPRMYRKKRPGPGPAPMGSQEQHKWISRRWQEVLKEYGTPAGYKAGCRWEKLRSERGGAAYLATYCGKEEQKEVPAGFLLPGRWWTPGPGAVIKDEEASVVLPLRDYLATVDGKLANDEGWLYGRLHNARERAATVFRNARRARGFNPWPESLRQMLSLR